ncbi:uncharacterized protein TNCV_2019221 [Trichonephila clavipes]|nr:uncharacterized protein TNCV_2019221 [Trichonephila clavipes]
MDAIIELKKFFAENPSLIELAVSDPITSTYPAPHASSCLPIRREKLSLRPSKLTASARAKNRFRKLWNNTRYQPYKREVNALIRQIRKEIEAHKNRTWKDLLLTLNPQDNSLYNLHRKITKRATVIPPLHGPGGMAYSDFEKRRLSKTHLKSLFRKMLNPTVTTRSKKSKNVVCNYFDNFTTLTPPLTSPIEVRGRNSPLSLENKVVLYKQVLRPIITYASPVWGAAAATHMKKIQVIQNKILRLITNTPWYVRNDVIHYDLHMEPISSYITKLARNVFRSIENHDNPIIRAQTMFTYPHPKLKYAYATAKWQLPLKPP